MATLAPEVPSLARDRAFETLYRSYVKDVYHFRGRNYLLGNSALSWGIHLPRIAERFDVTVEVSEWQNGWYVNTVYEDGMTNNGLVTGNWAADQRKIVWVPARTVTSAELSASRSLSEIIQSSGGAGR